MRIGAPLPAKLGQVGARDWRGSGRKRLAEVKQFVAQTEPSQISPKARFELP